LGSKLQNKTQSVTEDLLTDTSLMSGFVHDRMAANTTMTLWSTPNDVSVDIFCVLVVITDIGLAIVQVIPCICSTQRQVATLPSNAVDDAFQRGAEAYADVVGTCFFVAKYNSGVPFYFAIDCRSAEEKLLGQFPKAFALDPEVVTDGESLTNITSFLEPLASTTHIAIIGM
jgi:hypothetical protein